MTDRVLLSQGGGGEMTRELLREIFYKEFGSVENAQDDAALLQINSNRLAFTTDSFVVSPAFFNGGDIGKLAVCGTINDLCCGGAIPRYLSCAMIIEEGFEIQKLKIIVRSMAETAASCNVAIVTGDTKVVPQGMADGLYINTSGIGEVITGFSLSGKHAMAGDAVLVSGPVGMHGGTILAAREPSLSSSGIKSDCDPVLPLLLALRGMAGYVHVLRDPTRGGLAATSNEIALQSNVSIHLNESAIPVSNEVRGLCAITGIDPFNLACEGRLIAVVDRNFAEDALNTWKSTESGKDAALIGKVSANQACMVVLQTEIGGKRILRMPSGELLPRIC